MLSIAVHWEITTAFSIIPSLSAFTFNFLSSVTTVAILLLAQSGLNTGLDISKILVVSSSLSFVRFMLSSWEIRSRSSPLSSIPSCSLVSWSSMPLIKLGWQQICLILSRRVSRWWAFTLPSSESKEKADLINSEKILGRLWRMDYCRRCNILRQCYNSPFWLTVITRKLWFYYYSLFIKLGKNISKIWDLERKTLN